MANEVKLKLAIEGGAVVVQSVNGVSHSLDGLDRSAKNASTGAESLKTVLAGIATIGTAVAIIKMADSVTTLRTSLNLASNSAAEASVAYERLFSIAQQGRVNFTALGDTYASIARAGKELGVSQDRLLTVTQSIANAMTIGGGSAQSMQAALVQLGQGLSSGTLRGEELNSILEQTPRLAKALADGMGVPIGQLRSLGEQGKLTADTVISALEKSAPQLAKELNSATVTVGQAFTMLSNSATKFVGEADAASGASGNLAGVLQGLAGVVDSVGSTISNNKEAFSAIVNGLAGAAVAAGVVALAGSIGTVTTAVVTLGVAMAANPAILALTLIAAAGAGIASLASDWKKSAEGMRAQMDGINADIQLAEQRAATGSEPVKARAALELQTLRDKRDALRQTMAVQDQSSAENASYNAKEMKGLQAKVAAEQSAYAGAKPLDEVRKMAKLRNDILVDANDQAVNIAKGFSKSIASAASPQEAIALAKERDQRLIANAQETTAALKSFDDQKAAPAKEAAKRRLDAVIQYYEALQIESTAGEQRASRSLAAQHAAGLETDQGYYLAKKRLAENDNIAQQALVELEIAAVQKSGLNKQDQTAQLDKLNQELKRLREAAKDIEENFVNDMTVLDMKLFRQAIDENAQSVEAAQASAATLEEQVKAQRKANEEIGLSAREVNALRSARMELNATEKEGLATSIELASPAKAQALRDQATALRQLVIENTKGVERTAAVDSFKSMWDSVDQTAHGVWTNIYQGGQDAFTKLRDTLKSTVWDLLYQMTVRKWIFNIMAAVTGGSIGISSSSSGSGGGGSGGSILGGISSAKSVYDVASGGMAGIGTSLSSVGNLVGSASLSGYGAGLGLTSAAATEAAAAYTAAAAEIATSNAALAATYTEVASSLTAGATTASTASSTLAAIPGWGWVAMAALASVAGGPKIDFAGNGLSGQLSTSGSSLQKRTDYTEDHHGVFGIGSFTTHNSEYSAADSGVTAYMNTSLAAMTAATKGYAAVIGLSADAVDGFTKQIDLTLTGLSAADQQKALDAAISSFVDDMVTSAYGGALSAMAKTGETSSTTLQRVAVDLTTVNAMFMQLHETLLPVSLDGAKAAAGLVDAFGGLDKMQSAVSAYYDNFYSDSEKSAAALDSVTSAFSRLGISVPQSRDQFRALVDSIDTTTASGQTLYAAVVNLAPAFDQVSNAAQAAANKMLSAIQNWGTSADVKQFKAGQLQQTFANAGYSVDMNTILGATKESFMGYFNSLGADDPIKKVLYDNQQAIYDVVVGSKANDGGITSNAYGGGGGGGGGSSGETAAQSISNAWQAITDSIWGEVKRIRGLIEGIGPDAYAAAQARFSIATAQARAGDQEAAKALPELSKTLTALAETNARTLIELKMMQGATAGSLADTGTILSNKYGTTIPQFAGGGDHAGGWAMVGEQGPELAYLPPARIYTASQTGSMLGGGGADSGTADVVAELRATRQENALMREDIKRIKDILARVTPKGNAISVETVVIA